MQLVETTPATEPAEPVKAVVYYAFACTYSKKWFLCRSRRKRFKQLVLLFKLVCIPSAKPLHIPAKEPVVGGVYADTDGSVVECLEVEWI